jgi:hypothetical protein
MSGMDDAAVLSLLEAVADLAPLGAWVSDAACRGLDGFTHYPHDDELRLLERICRRCPVLASCAALGASEPVTASVYAGQWRNSVTGTVRGVEAA